MGCGLTAKEGGVPGGAEGQEAKSPNSWLCLLGLSREQPALGSVSLLAGGKSPSRQWGSQPPCPLLFCALPRTGLAHSFCCSRPWLRFNGQAFLSGSSECIPSNSVGRLCAGTSLGRAREQESTESRQGSGPRGCQTGRAYHG